jgi:hypothetical protein
MKVGEFHDQLSDSEFLKKGFSFLDVVKEVSSNYFFCRFISFLKIKLCDVKMQLTFCSEL